MFWVEGRARRKCVLANLPKKLAFYFLKKAIMYFCQPLPTLKQLNLLCSNFPKQFALRLLPELQHLHPEDERGGVPRLRLRVCTAEAPAELLSAFPALLHNTGNLGASLCLGSGRELLTGMLNVTPEQCLMLLHLEAPSFWDKEMEIEPSWIWVPAGAQHTLGRESVWIYQGSMWISSFPEQNSIPR